MMRGNNSRILIVDDEENIRRICSKALARMGIVADVAGSAEEGMKMIDSQRYEVVLLDIMLPGMDGMKFLNILKKKIPYAEVIMLTGKGTIKDAVESMKQGAYDFITKPFEIHEIRKTVQKALEKEDLAKEVRELQDIINIYEVSLAIGRLMPTDELIKIVFSKALKTIRADSISIALYEMEKKELVIKYVYGKDEMKLLGRAVKIKNVEDDKIKNITVSEDNEDEENFLRKMAVYKSIKDTDDPGIILNAPMIIKDEFIGSLSFRRAEDSEEFSKYDIKVATIFAQVVGMAIQNAKDYDKLKELDDLKTEFIANVSHELRTPLQSITNSCDIVSKMDTDKKIIAILQRNTERMRGLIDQLLDFSKIEEGKYELNYSTVNIENLVQEAVEELRGDAEKKDIEFDIELSDLPELEIDRNAIKRVLLNLIENAIKYCAPVNRIILGAERDEGQIRFWVKDNGCGIPKQDQRHIFERFYQQSPEKPFMRKNSGLGLGLVIAKELVEAHRGSIFFNSEQGKGSTFSFVLPNTM